MSPGDMATAEIWRRRSGRFGLMEESSGCANEAGAGSLRRRRMEIRRIKMMSSSNSNASLVIAEQPVSKRLRPVSGVLSNVQRGEEVEGEVEVEVDVAVEVEVDADVVDVVEAVDVVEDVVADGKTVPATRDAPLLNRSNAMMLCGSSSCSDEWGQGNPNNKNRSVGTSRLSVCGVMREPRQQAAPSLSTAWDMPFGGVRRVSGENECAINASDVVGNHSSDRMSSGGSSGSAQHIEESDVTSTLTTEGGGFHATLGNEVVATTPAAPSQAFAEAGRPRGSKAQELPTRAPLAATGSGPESSSGTVADMSSADTVTVAHVENPHLDAPGAFPLQRQASLPWSQRSLGHNDGTPNANAAAASDAGGSGVPSNCFTSTDCPPHGMVSLCGRRREMEDAVVSKDSFVKVPCNKVGGCDSAGLELAPLHYFGVYDGHGGSQAANFCAERLHEALAEEVESCFVQGQNVDQNSSDWESKWLTTMTQCFKRMDAEVGGFCLEEGECPVSDNPRCCPEPIAPETVGTTAIVAVVGACQIIVGNCGDSRAVLSRGGVAIPLSVDHKPEREDEMARIEAAGGRVIYWNGYRVLGVLAMSRAIGDRYLKPYVIPEPEVRCIKRAEDDDCLILASDGLWDVMSNEVVCDIARRALNCRRNGQAATDTFSGSASDDESLAAQAAALLVKLALAKGSSDNISVVVVDLKAPRNR